MSTATTHHASTLPETRERLLNAAIAVFAENGFRNATVRDICERANANVAAVNYHFGDKAGLYAAVWQRFCEAVQPDPAPPHDRSYSAEADLRARLRFILSRIFMDNSISPLWRLFIHELAEPTAALDTFIRHVVAPSQSRWEPIVRDLLGPTATAEEVTLAVHSIVAQYVFYCQNRALLERTQPQWNWDDAMLDRLADHIARFCLHALRGLRGEK